MCLSQCTGGVQLLNFGSVGRAQHAHLESVQIAHGSSVFVTVVVTNAAGVKTVIYSDPHVVDLTPPQLCCVKVNINKFKVNM